MRCDCRDTVAEVEASPPGPHIGAFFDLDGTLVAGFTGVMLTQDQFCPDSWASAT